MQFESWLVESVSQNCKYFLLNGEKIRLMELVAEFGRLYHKPRQPSTKTGERDTFKPTIRMATDAKKKMRKVGQRND